MPQGRKIRGEKKKENYVGGPHKWEKVLWKTIADQVPGDRKRKQGWGPTRSEYPQGGGARKAENLEGPRT